MEAALEAEKQAAGARSIAVKPEANRAYNDFLLQEFPKYSWGHSSCNSYYRSADGRAPFLFPGDFDAFVEAQAEAGLQDFEAI